MNKMLMEQNDRLQKQVSLFVYEYGYMKKQLTNPSAVTTDTSCEFMITSGQRQQQQNLTSYPLMDSNNPAGLLAKVTRTAVDWVRMLGMKACPISIGIVADSQNCGGVKA